MLTRREAPRINRAQIPHVCSAEKAVPPKAPPAATADWVLHNLQVLVQKRFDSLQNRPKEHIKYVSSKTPFTLSTLNTGVLTL